MAIKDGSRFDFIVVGGGTAGNIVASRLAENPKVRILIVEAGIGSSRDNEEIRTPGRAMDIRGSQYDWAYKTTMVKRPDYERIEKPNTRGKALGGSSSLNYFSWVPGSKGTFDMWEEYGGKEWTWDHLLPYLRKSVTYHDDEGLYPKALSKIGAGGPIPISHARLMPEMAPFRQLLTKAWQSTGEPVSENIFDGEMRGLVHSVNTIYQGRRSGSFLALEGKSNITVLAETHSKKLIIDQADGSVKGVTVIAPSGGELSFYAEREVIVSEGVFESPKLLMLSGIGPKEELAKHNIPVLVDSQHVGQHLLDHPGVPFVLRIKDEFSMDSHVLRKGPDQDKLLAAYKHNHAGAMGSPFLEMIGFPRIDKYLEKSPEYRQRKAANGNKDPFCPYGQPHFELDFIPLFGSAFQWHFPHPKRGSYMTVMVDLVRPVSEGGTVTLNSADPLEQANINLNYFNDDLDIIAVREGIRFSYDILKKGPGFKDIVEDEYPWDMPLDDDEAMKRTVLDRCQTSFHPCGTARIGKNIKQGAVDAGLRVFGVKGLRVIDASVIPVIPDCRIQNSVYMVAEKGADAIKADYKDLY
ncbi:Glucose-methanol-choline oxidoreductase [Cordyceps militaris]|uniref:Glucose-methanol-choline oxidoreductase n=1 Tax=Cordyceps militaris TaxID=73501 RepID=A0A2H4SI65_CORMI|nr:Glucose-methanol-choline oxidoreductase [Cordyceps militaris]